MSEAESSSCGNTDPTNSANVLRQAINCVMINVFMGTDIKTYGSINPNSRQQPANEQSDNKPTPATGRKFVSYPVPTSLLSFWFPFSHNEMKYEQKSTMKTYTELLHTHTHTQTHTHTHTPTHPPTHTYTSTHTHPHTPHTHPHPHTTQTRTHTHTPHTHTHTHTPTPHKHTHTHTLTHMTMCSIPTCTKFTLHRSFRKLTVATVVVCVSVMLCCNCSGVCACNVVLQL